MKAELKLVVREIRAAGGDSAAKHQIPAMLVRGGGDVASLHALKRIAQPDEVARAALFLAPDHASFVTGTAMLVDGGVSVTRT